MSEGRPRPERAWPMNVGRQRCRVPRSEVARILPARAVRRWVVECSVGYATHTMLPIIPGLEQSGVDGTADTRGHRYDDVVRLLIRFPLVTSERAASHEGFAELLNEVGPIVAGASVRSPPPLLRGFRVNAATHFVSCAVVSFPSSNDPSPVAVTDPAQAADSPPVRPAGAVCRHSAWTNSTAPPRTTTCTTH